MTPPAYTVPATLPGLLAPQLRAVVISTWDPPVYVTVLRVDPPGGALGTARVWDGGDMTGVWPVRGMHLDLRDRLTAAHVAWWLKPMVGIDVMLADGELGAVTRAQAGRSDPGDPEALAALVMRLAGAEVTHG